MNKILEIKNLSKDYHTINGEISAIEDISLDIYKNEIIGIVGSSGCGKSTLLSILSGIEKQSSGEIISNNNNFSYMLQSDALMPWLNIIDNACLGLDIKHLKTPENIAYVEKLLSNFGLSAFLKAYPNNLSGGMRQRVALVRTLATKPDIILLDEPLSALDYVTRLTISDDIYKLIKKSNVTTILISHDIAECISMCDRIVVLTKRPGKIKNIYNINLKNKKTPSENRKDKLFVHYYDLVWGDLDKDIT
ncbi:MAG: ABC transporter ATP-binding protein [Bacilli bacterium]|nr:ABC transporter ATP-binding protein [Bacilli bacterium]MDD4407140.1 ABC transporter ATP-binding protein [Bacilli bacterium]